MLLFEGDHASTLVFKTEHTNIFSAQMMKNVQMMFENNCLQNALAHFRKLNVDKRKSKNRANKLWGKQF